jgi:predicted NBD/HSP70 family sugar kinase
VAALVPVLDPELVILGGPIGGNGDLLLEPVARFAAELVPFPIRVEASPLGEEAVVLGAVWMALQSS